MRWRVPSLARRVISLRCGISSLTGHSDMAEFVVGSTRSRMTELRHRSEENPRQATCYFGPRNMISTW